MPALCFSSALEIAARIRSRELSALEVRDYFRKRVERFNPRIRNHSAEHHVHHDWLQLHEQRGQRRLRWQQFFKHWDLVICPIAASTAFPHNHGAYRGRKLLVDGVQLPYFQQLFWTGLATCSYLPSTAFRPARRRKYCRWACKPSARNATIASQLHLRHGWRGSFLAAARRQALKTREYRNTCC